MNTKHTTPRRRSRGLQLAAVTALTALMGVSGSAGVGETLLMPTREFLAGEKGVVWGISTINPSEGTGCTLDFGDGTVVNCNGSDKSYIAYEHTYAAPGAYTVTLNVNGQTAQVLASVLNPVALSDAEERGVRINMAIQDGLRYLWSTQDNRQDFETTPYASWGNSGFPLSMTSLVVLAFENHGYLLPNNNDTPSGLYQKYVVQRGLNYIAQNLNLLSLSVQQPGDRNPCVGLTAEQTPCAGLYNAFEDPGYGTALAALPFAASNASTRMLPIEIAGEDANGNGVIDSEDLDGDGNLDWGDEDWDGDGVWDLYYDCDPENGYDYQNEDVDGDGNQDVHEDANFNGSLDPGEDVDGDGRLDYEEVDWDGDGVLERAYQDCDGDGDFSHEDWDFDANWDTQYEDTNFNGVLDNEDSNYNGVLDAGLSNQTIGNVLQRLVNAIAFGQNDEVPAFGPCNYPNGFFGANCGRGGWIYDFTDSQGSNQPGVFPPTQSSDGSTLGWDVLAMLDSAAAGATIPSFVMPELRDHALIYGLNNDGSFDYQADGTPGSPNSTNPAKAGIALQALFWTGAQHGVDPRVQTSIDYITSRWGPPGSGEGFACSNGRYNFGCGYAMFNIFKALKLHNVGTLPIGDPDGPGPLSFGDWHGAYEDYLLASQQGGNTLFGGQWDTPTMGFSCCHSGSIGITALAELVLAPVALVLPDPEFFGEVGLTHSECIAAGGAPETCNGEWTNPARTLHNVTARAMSFPSTGGDRAPVPGASVDFVVLSGPNVGKSGADITDANGEATFEYTDDRTTRGCDADGDNDIDDTDLAIIRTGYGPAAAPTIQTDTIRANIGAIQSNIVVKRWLVLDPRDGNANGTVNALDLRYCQLRKGT